jgi:hypothetical protein
VIDPRDVEDRMKKLNDRVERIEQILPTLATKVDLSAAIAPLATKAELAVAIAPLATKAELAAAIAPLATRDELHAAIKEEGVRTRQHFDVVAERLEGHIKLIAEGHVALNEKVNALSIEMRTADETLDRRVTRLEAKR